MKRIGLTNSSRMAMVSNRDFTTMRRFSWYLHKNGHAQTVVKGTPNKRVRMHNLIRPVPKGFLVDHKDRNKLNNQRGNLRKATKSQNAQNMGISNSKRKTSRFKGVSFHPFSGLWHAHIMKDYKSYSLRYHRTQTAAARAYNDAAKRLFGSFARLNPV